MNWDHYLSTQAKSATSSIIRDLLKLLQSKDIISLGGGLPAPELFPVQEFDKIASRTLFHYGSSALQYGPTDGIKPLREWIAHRMKEVYGVRWVGPDNIMITTGSQQALDLIGKVFINPNDVILTENPSYLGALQAFKSYQSSFISFEMDEDGLMIKPFEEFLEKKATKYEENFPIKFAYLMPAFQNPTGKSLADDRKQPLMNLLKKYSIPLVEDDPYGELYFGMDKIKPLAAYDTDGEMTIYTSTFSKTLAPGLRLGWIAAPQEILSKLIMAKQSADLHSSSLSQYIAYEFCASPSYETHLQKIRDTYKARRDTLASLLKQYVSPEIKIAVPEGGMFLWLELPEGYNTADLLPKAIENNVAYVMGEAFYPNPEATNKRTMRLNFSYCDEATLKLAVERLAKTFEDAGLHK
jgi:2-aminoadipate transaminase